MNPTKYDQEVLKDFPLDELVLVVRFGEPIYPVMTPDEHAHRFAASCEFAVVIGS